MSHSHTYTVCMACMPVHTVTHRLGISTRTVHNTVFMYPEYTQTNTFRENTPNRHFTVNVTLLDQAKAKVYGLMFSSKNRKCPSIKHMSSLWLTPRFYMQLYITYLIGVQSGCLCTAGGRQACLSEEFAYVVACNTCKTYYMLHVALTVCLL